MMNVAPTVIQPSLPVLSTPPIALPVKPFLNPGVTISLSNSGPCQRELSTAPALLTQTHNRELPAICTTYPRAFTKAEQKAIQQGLQQRMPYINPEDYYTTLIPQMLASPEKEASDNAKIMGCLTAIITAGITGLNAWGAFRDYKPVKTFIKAWPLMAIPAGIGAVITGITYLVTQWSRDENNKFLLNCMKRLPEGATEWDLMQLPAWQTRILQQEAAQTRSEIWATTSVATSLSSMRNKSS
jgi:hypothetical protein